MQDDFRIIWFQDRFKQDRILTHVSRAVFTGPYCASAELLRWHFRHAVLHNMRGSIDPLLREIPSTRVADILQRPGAAERMEAEILGRLALEMDLDKPGTLHDQRIEIPPADKGWHDYCERRRARKGRNWKKQGC